MWMRRVWIRRNAAITARDATASSFSQVQHSWPRSSRLWITRGKVKFRVGEESSKMDRMIRVRDDVHMTICTEERLPKFWPQAGRLRWFISSWQGGGGSKIPEISPTSYVPRRGRLGSGNGKPRILSLLVLSRADISESTQNHLELIWIILTESGAQMLHFFGKI